MPQAGRPTLFIGNWKMNLTATQAGGFLGELLRHLAPGDDREIAVAPPFTSLSAAAAALRGTAVRLAAQDIASEDKGPYTGEISGPMLVDLGVSFALAGHSERRQHLGETDHMVSLKVAAALRADLRPVLCVGEQETERAAGRAEAVVRSQVVRGLERVAQGQAGFVEVAYEPVWAIGTGKAASPADATAMASVIRRELENLFGERGRAVRILYGGSVTPANIDAFLAAPGIDGALVGGASLDAAAFARIAGARR